MAINGLRAPSMALRAGGSSIWCGTTSHSLEWLAVRRASSVSETLPYFLDNRPVMLFGRKQLAACSLWVHVGVRRRNPSRYPGALHAAPLKAAGAGTLMLRYDPNSLRNSAIGCRVGRGG